MLQFQIDGDVLVGFHYLFAMIHDIWRMVESLLMKGVPENTMITTYVYAYQLGYKVDISVIITYTAS